MALFLTVSRAATASQRQLELQFLDTHTAMCVRSLLGWPCLIIDDWLCGNRGEGYMYESPVRLNLPRDQVQLQACFTHGG